MSQIQREFDVEVTIADLFLYDTIQQQATFIIKRAGTHVHVTFHVRLSWKGTHYLMHNSGYGCYVNSTELMWLTICHGTTLSIAELILIA